MLLHYRTLPVESFYPNALGFYNMHGNVSEWCQDWYGDYPYIAVINPTNPRQNSSRVLRGGSWSKTSHFARSANREQGLETAQDASLGLRIALQESNSSAADPSGLDILEPELTILSPSDGSSVQAASILIRGTASDAARGGNGIKFVSVNGQPVAGATATGKEEISWESAVELVPGMNEIFIQTMDAQNNPTARNLKIYSLAEIESIPAQQNDFHIKSIDAHMIWIEPGTFVMGSPETEIDRREDEVQHTVTLTAGFWLGETEVTQAQWAEIAENNPSFFSGSSSFPVERVSWHDCMKFCERLTEMERGAGRLPETMMFTLPTEAQWEYACRAGGQATGPFHFGNSLSSSQANFNGNLPYGGAPRGLDLERTARVKSYPPSALGLYDMHGNVEEWCLDWHGFYPTEAVTDPVGPLTGYFRIYRGGNWDFSALNCRAAHRDWENPTYWSSTIGFRLALVHKTPDILGPVITILSPLDGGIVDSSSIVIRGRVSDSDRGGNGIKSVTVNRQPVLAAVAIGHNDVDWEISLALSPGSNEIALQAEDGLGNLTQVVMHIEQNQSMGVVPIPSRDFLVGTLNSRMIWVEPGTFMMGSPETEVDRSFNESQNSVTLSDGYWIGETEVTQAQWTTHMEFSPGTFRKSGNLPVDYVSWESCLEFCRRLTEQERAAGRLSDSMVYTLPTEAQWEYACREEGRATGPFHFGDSLSSFQANFDGTSPYGGAAIGPVKAFATWVKSYPPNALGIYDMHGNVMEWCLDWYGTYPKGAVTDPTGPQAVSSPVLRGGSYFDVGSQCRSASRSYHSGMIGGSHTGFRLVLRHNVQDKSEPSLIILNPIEGAIVNSSSLTVTGIATDNWRGGHGIQSISVNGQTIAGASVTGNEELRWEYPIELVSGPNGIVVQTQDELNNQSAVMLTIFRSATTGSIPVPSQDHIVGSLGTKIIWVESGTFEMGAPVTELNRFEDEHQHTVTLTQGYWIGETEVTQSQWTTIMDGNPSFFSGSGILPVEQVSWNDCMEFCQRLTAFERASGRLAENMFYTLPTEAQWEYACREEGRATGPFHYSETLGSNQANFNGYRPIGDDYLWRTWAETIPVKSFQPNALGIYDMHGNVEEWCLDWYGTYPKGVAVTDPKGSPQGTVRVTRGGGWFYWDYYCRSATRSAGKPLLSDSNLGFRLTLLHDE